jgi:uncharacterized repeat protein (TIGR04052 family)
MTFDALVGDEPARCGVSYDGLGVSSRSAQLADARLFVSRIEARNTAGLWTPMLLETNDWQHEGVALLDFEDGTGACADSGTAETNVSVTGTLPAGDYDGVRFQVGIPFELNHLDSATAPSPLNAPGMFWAWQGGYKFARVDWTVADGDTARWNIHLGSTGCVSPSSTTPPEQPCERGNLPIIELVDIDLDAQVVRFDLKSLVANADIAANTQGTAPGCMSGPGEPDDCGSVFAAFGLAFNDGNCANDCAGQTVFSMAE